MQADIASFIVSYATIIVSYAAQRAGGGLCMPSHATAAVTGAGTGDLRVRRAKADSRGCMGALFERPFMDSQWLSMGVSSRPPRELALEREAWRSTGRKRVKPVPAPVTAAA